MTLTQTTNSQAEFTPDAIATKARPARANNWIRALAPFQTASRLRGLLELGVTAAPFAALWTAAFFAYWLGYWWLSLLIAIPAGGFLVRLFMIQHDCGHGSFFPNKAENDWCGRILSVLTLTPYDYWRRTHSRHHATCGNLDRRGIGDIDTLTVAEYRALSPMGRLRYRIYRHPFVLFVIGPAYLFLLRQRLPAGLWNGGWQPWMSTQLTNLAIAALFAGGMWLMGWQAFLFVHLPIVLIAASLGVWLFYVQHQFEDTSWRHNTEWDFQDAALHGSSHYDLPQVLRWLTANIGMHHVHHLSSRIPYYRLPAVLRAYPELRDVGRITLLDSLGCLRLRLWDERSKRLIGFSEERMAAH